MSFGAFEPSSRVLFESSSHVVFELSLHIVYLLVILVVVQQHLIDCIHHCEMSPYSWLLLNPDREIDNVVLQITIKFTLEANNRTIVKPCYIFWHGIENAHCSPSKDIVGK